MKGGPYPLADLDQGGPNPLADMDRGVQIRRGSKSAVTPASDKIRSTSLSESENLQLCT